MRFQALQDQVECVVRMRILCSSSLFWFLPFGFWMAFEQFLNGSLLYDMCLFAADDPWGLQRIQKVVKAGTSLCLIILIFVFPFAHFHLLTFLLFKLFKNGSEASNLSRDKDQIHTFNYLFMIKRKHVSLLSFLFFGSPR